MPKNVNLAMGDDSNLSADFTRLETRTCGTPRTIETYLTANQKKTRASRQKPLSLGGKEKREKVARYSNVRAH